MTLPMLLVLLVLALAIFLFMTDVVRVDVVGVLMMILLPMLGLVTPAQALSGLSSNAVVSIIAVIIIGAAMDKTGVMNVLARHILRYAGTRERRIMVLVSSTVALISGFMQNIGAAALFLPATRRIALQTGIPTGRLLLPLAYCAIIGGCLTLVGSSPLILLNDLMEIDGVPLHPFSLFSVTPVGIALVVAALIYFFLLGKHILPESKVQQARGPMSVLLDKTYHDVGSIFELHIPQNFVGPLSLKTLALRPSYYTSVVAIRSADGTRHIIGPDAETELNAGDRIAVVGPHPYVEALACDLCWKLRPFISSFSEDLSPTNAGIVEGLITPRSELVGTTIHDFGMRTVYHITPLALFREGSLVMENLHTIRLQAGDALLLHGTWKHFQLLREKQDLLVFTERLPGETLRQEKARTALTITLLTICAILFTNLSLPIALLSGALGMILSKTISIDEAYQAVDWMSVFLLAGLLPLGQAFENTGAAAYLAQTLVNLLGAPSPLLLLTLIAVLTSFFTLFTSNVGATVLMVPLAMNMAIDAQTDPRIAALTVGLCASNTFILPTHQVNALVMRPGGFQSRDYLRAGTGMTLVYLFVVIVSLFFFY